MDKDSENQSEKKRDVQDPKQRKDGKNQINLLLKSHTCSKCGKFFARAAAFEGHMRTHQTTDKDYNLKKQEEEDNLKKQEFNQAIKFKYPRKVENPKYSKRSSDGINPMARFNNNTLFSMGRKDSSSMANDTSELKGWADKARQRLRVVYAYDTDVVYAAETLMMISRDRKWINPFKDGVGLKKTSSITSGNKSEKGINPKSRFEARPSSDGLSALLSKGKAAKGSPITSENKAEKGINQDFHPECGVEARVSKNLDIAQQLVRSEMNEDKEKAIKNPDDHHDSRTSEATNEDDYSDDHHDSRRSSEATKKCHEFDLNELPDMED